LLIFGAHPDDAELSCGGTILKMVESGKKAGIIDLTGGEYGTRGNKKIRAKETKEAGKILGIKVRENLGFKDTSIENSFANRLKIIKLIRMYRPQKGKSDIYRIPFLWDSVPECDNFFIQFC
jgi:LmbE family N-acetylglucosaminyl deacetylase